MVEESELSAALRLDMAAARMAAIEQAGDAGGHLVDDEGGEDAVAVGAADLGECRRMHSVEDEEARADEQEEGELEEDDDAAGEQREARFAEVLGGEHALDHELVGAVRGHGEEGSAEDAGPEGVGRGSG